MTLYPENYENSQFPGGTGKDPALDEEQETLFSVVTADRSLHRYYNDSWLSSAKQRDQNSPWNELVMEYFFLPIHHNEITDWLDPPMDSIMEQVSRETPYFDLARKTYKMQTLFHVNKEVFFCRWDRENEIMRGMMEYAYQFSALRSFAWTLADYCARNNVEPEEVSLDLLHRIVRLIAKQKWLNYQGDSFCPGLCSGNDLDCCYLPDTVRTGNPELAKKIFKACAIYSDIPEQINSLDELRRDLEYIYPAVRKLWEDLKKDRNYNQPLIGDQADVVYAWCVFVGAATKPFYLKRGNEYYEFQYIESWSEIKMKLAAKWIAEYGEYLNRDQKISVSGKIFVFSGFGGKRKEKTHPLVKKVLEQGGLYRTVITKSTNYVVVDPENARDPACIETIEALERQKNGSSIQIILRSDLESALGMEDTEMYISSFLVKEPDPCADYKVDDSGTLVSYASDRNLVVLPKGIQAIGKKFLKNSMRKNKELYAVTLSEGVQVIEEQGFSDCSELIRVNLPSTLKEIGDEAFASCFRLTEMIIPEGVTKIGRKAFVGCDSLQDLYFLGWDIEFGIDVLEDVHNEVYENLCIHAPEGSDALICAQDYALEYDNQLPPGVKLEDLLDKRKNRTPKPKEALPPTAVILQPGDYESKQPGRLDRYTGTATAVIIPDGIQEIGAKAFYEKNIVSAVIPEGVVTIGEGAFECCEKLEQVVLPKSLKRIEDRAFLKCRRLSSVQFPEGINYIGCEAFGSCNCFTKLILPSGLKELAELAFVNCKRLSTLKIQANIREIPCRCFFGCISLEEVQLPDSLKIIQEDAFYNCKKLSSIVVPEGVEELQDNSFWYCENLEEVKLPNSLQRIGKCAFIYCHKLKQIVIPSNVTQIEQEAFCMCYQLKQITILSKKAKLGEEILGRVSHDQVIHLKPGSYAEQYAKENHISYDYELPLDLE